MKRAVIKIKITTPCISAGADQKVAEIRSQSIRGGLHDWFRVLGGTLEEEQCIFGRIGKQEVVRRSSLNVRVITPEKMRTSVKDCKSLTGSDVDYFLWPLRDQKHTPGSVNRGIIEAGEQFELRLSHTRIQGGAALSADVLKAYVLLGSLGTRSRRCYGSLWPLEATIDDENWLIPSTLDDFSSEIGRMLDGRNISIRLWESCTSWRDAIKSAAHKLQACRCGSPKSGTPTEWGQNDHDVPLKRGGDLFRPALGLPLMQRYSSREHGTWNTFVKARGQEKDNDRWASPLLLKVVPLESRYHVLAVFLNEYVLPEGTELNLKSRNGRASARLSLDLWRELKTVGKIII